MILFIITMVFITIAVLVVGIFLKSDQGSREPPIALWAALGMGVVALVAAIFMEANLLPDKLNLKTIHELSLGTRAFSFIGVGLIEEAAKFFPLAAILWRKDYFNEHTDGIIYFTVCGFGFGVVENIGYTLVFDAKAGVARIFLVPIFHASITAFLGYFLIKAKLKNRKFYSVLPYFILFALLHSLYDFGLVSGVIMLAILSFIITVSLTVGLFLLFGKAKAKDQALGISSIGHNKYCRACGRENTNRSVYCEYCGQRA